MWIGSVVLAVILGAVRTVLGDGWLSRIADVKQVGTLREVDQIVLRKPRAPATA